MSKKKFFKILILWDETQIGFIRYFIPVIQKQKLLEIERRELNRKGLKAIVQEEIGVDDFKYIVGNDEKDLPSAEDYVPYDDELPTKEKQDDSVKGYDGGYIADSSKGEKEI